MTKHLLTLFLGATVFAVVGLAAAQRQPPDPPDAGQVRDNLMRKKLEHAQKVLEGVAVNNFEMIERYADELIILSKRAEWRVLQTPEYTRQSDEFRRNAATLIKAAKDKNTDAAALGYVQMTMSCVSCHKYIRETRVGLLDGVRGP
jgi:hypothetical protein